MLAIHRCVSGVQAVDGVKAAGSKVGLSAGMTETAATKVCDGGLRVEGGGGMPAPGGATC